MRRRVLAGALVVALVVPVGLAAVPAAQALPEPTGSCTYQAAGASLTLTPLAGGLSLEQAFAGFPANVVTAPSGCLFLVAGVFHVSDSITPLICIPYEFGPVAGTQCISIGVARIASPEFAPVMSFDGTITALNDGASQSVGCSASFEGNHANCYFGSPGTIDTL